MTNLVGISDGCTMLIDSVDREEKKGTIMDDPITTFFEQLATSGYEPLLHTVSGTYRFEIEDAGNWCVTVTQGTLSVTRELPQASCVIICARDLFCAIVRGEQNPTTAFMQGRIQVKGSLSLAQVFQRIFRVRPETRLAWGVTSE